MCYDDDDDDDDKQHTPTLTGLSFKKGIEVDQPFNLQYKCFQMGDVQGFECNQLSYIYLFTNRS